MKRTTHDADDAQFVPSYDTERSLNEDASGFDAVDRMPAGTRADEQVQARDERPGGDDDRRSRIEARAYQLYLEHGDRNGGDVEDWLEAEREMAAEDADER